MAAKVDYDAVEAGTQIPAREFTLKRVDLLRYCGACCDFTGIHWNERIARTVGLPDVIAHGALTLAEAVRAVTDWAGDPGAVVEYTTRFSRPVVVPDDDMGATLQVSGVVEEKLPGNQVAIELTVRSGGVRVLSSTRTVVQLS
jgi:acyl dehydratase